MLAQIFKSRRNLRLALSFFAPLVLISCASQKKQEPLISDSHGHESALPWNKQEQWEIAPNVPTQLQGRDH
jgi:hypothetical protein